MARAIWKGTLGFGLVSIPVEVHKAVRDLGPHFRLLRRSDKSRIQYQKIAARDGEVVSRDELVKGFEYSKGRYVILEPEDFEAAAVDRHRRIDLLAFVEGDQVDDRYFEKPYYLLPGEGGESSYALLREALRDADRIGIAKFVMRDKPHLAAVEVVQDALVLSTMRFRETLVPVADLSFPDAELRKADVKLARQLVDALAADWKPDDYTDEYRANLMEIIEARRNAQEPELERQEIAAEGKVVDLMERLRQSVEQAGGRASRSRASKKAASSRGRTRGQSRKVKRKSKPARAASKKSRARRAA